MLWHLLGWRSEEPGEEMRSCGSWQRRNDEADYMCVTVVKSFSSKKVKISRYVVGLFYLILSLGVRESRISNWNRKFNETLEVHTKKKGENNRLIHWLNMMPAVCFCLACPPPGILQYMGFT